MFGWRKRLALLLPLLLLVAAVLPVSAADHSSSQEVDALVYYGGSLTEQSLTERHGVTPVIRYEQYALAHLTAGQLQSLQRTGATVQILSDRRRIELGGGFDTRRGDGVPAALRMAPPAGVGTYLVQFAGPIKQAWVDALTSRGAAVYGYVPQFALLVRATPVVIQQIKSLPQVEWTGLYQPAYKLAPGLTGGEAVAELFPWAENELSSMQAPGLTVSELHDGRARIKGDRQALEQAARLDSVAFIAPWAEPQLLNAVSRTVIKSDVAHGKSVTGSGQIVAISDTGVYKAHEAFSEAGKVVAVIDVAGDSAASGGDGHGHGSHVAGSVLGDAPAFGQYTGYDGQGFGARLVDVKIFDNAGAWAGGSDYYGFWNAAYGKGARVNQNSWGASTGGAYSDSDRDADRISFDHKDYLLSIAAGNSGPGANTVGSPGTAKNDITVGATKTASAQDMASFSSRGPTDDNRIKPDVVAPGSYIHSVKRGTTNEYTDMQGTSMATPQVSGSAALVRQYFKDGFYPSGTKTASDSRDPSGALVKAVLINGAVEIIGSGSDVLNENKFPNNSQGWGQINLDRSLYFSGDTRKMTLWDEPAAPATGTAWSQSLNVTDGSEEVKFTLTWTDPPAAAGAAVSLVNDLHLRVTAPNGTLFMGNNFTGRNPGYSVSGGSPDARNTVEGVHLVPGRSFPGNLPTGTYKIEVVGANVPTVGSNFAVVVSHAPASASPPPSLGDVAVMGDYNDQLSDLLRANGLTVTTYAGDDYASVINNLGSHKAVVLHKVGNATGFDDLLTAAAAKQRGVVFASSYPVSSHSMGILSAHKTDPASVAQTWMGGPVKLTVAKAHPIFDGYAVGTTVTVINGGDNDYQTYDGYAGTTIGTSAMSSGKPSMIGYKDAAATDGSRQVVMGSFGASSYTNTAHWTADGKKIFVNAVKWAAGQTGSNPPPPTPPPAPALAVMGDYSNQISDFLRSKGYTVDNYTSTDYAGITANIGKYQAVLLHNVSNDPGFDNLLSKAGTTGIIYLSAYPGANHGMGVLSSRKGDPSAISQFWKDGPVTLKITDPTHPIFAGFTTSQIVVINGGDNDYQAYSGFTGTTIGTSGMPRGFAGMVGVRDGRSAGGNRQVLMGALGASSWTNVTHWTDDGKKLLVNAVEWAKRP